MSGNFSVLANAIITYSLEMTELLTTTDFRHFDDRRNLTNFKKFQQTKQILCLTSLNVRRFLSRGQRTNPALLRNDGPSYYHLFSLILNA